MLGGRPEHVVSVGGRLHFVNLLVDTGLRLLAAEARERGQRLPHYESFDKQRQQAERLEPVANVVGCAGHSDQDDMQRRRHTPEQIVRKLREADRMLGEGTALVEVCKHLEVSEQTYYRWRNQYGGMKADDAKRLKELERENSRLKRIVADQVLDIDMLKELNRGNF